MTQAEGARCLSRELSWLAFDGRVLEEAADARWPLLERVKFLAIYHSNLDEFFMIRVSGLKELVEAGATVRGPDGLTPAEELVRVREVVRRQLQAASALLSDELLPALSAAGIHVREWEALDPAGQAEARQYFRSTVFPVLTPLAVDPGHPFPFISNLSLSLAVEVEEPRTGQRRFARVKVPEILPRFLPVGAQAFLPLESLIVAHLDALFPGMKVLGAYAFRITRDMDLDIREVEALDLLQTVDRQLRRRKFGSAVRLEVVPRAPARIRTLLLEKLELGEGDLYETPDPMGAAALLALAALPRPDLRDPPFTPAVRRELLDGDPFAAIRARDVLLHHPYDSFAPVLALLRRAAVDPGVLAIKITLYRTGDNAELVEGLITAAEHGKQVAVAIELQARFDEQKNIEWARALERAGVHVFFGSAGLKMHAKACLIVRREQEQILRYVHLSTGNYNPGTARLYTDAALLTCDPEIGEDVSELFNSLSGFSRPKFRKLAVAPETLKETVLGKISAQAERARAGKPARIFAKMNALVDVEVIEALCAASSAGVEIDLDVRGICCLRPAVPGLSERIRVFSIVGRFLEHSRVFAFGPEGEEELYLSSADWMPRSFHRRVELMFPVRDEAIRERLRQEVIRPALRDNVRARELAASGEYRRRVRVEAGPECDSQATALAISQQSGLRATSQGEG